MKAPTIHLNGTSEASLMEQHDLAIEAVNKAVNALLDCYPNGRDYYPQGDGAYEQARREHDARVKAVVAVRDDLMQIRVMLFEQVRR